MQFVVLPNIVPVLILQLPLVTAPEILEFPSHVLVLSRKHPDLVLSPALSLVRPGEPTLPLVPVRLGLRLHLGYDP